MYERIKKSIVIIILVAALLLSGCVDTKKFQIGEKVQTTKQYNPNETFYGTVIEMRDQCDYYANGPNCRGHYTVMFENKSTNSKWGIDEDYIIKTMN